MVAVALNRTVAQRPVVDLSWTCQAVGRGRRETEQIEVLGRAGVRSDGQRRELAGRQPALLAALAIATPRAVASDRLVELIWAQKIPADPANALQQRISALRQLLDPERTGRPVVTTVGGYALDVADGVIDARRFAHLAAQGHVHLANGEPARARQSLQEALGLWSGPAFDGLAHEPWAIAEAQRLEELRAAAIEDRIEAELALGLGEELIAELTELVIASPLRERRSSQLMRALYRAGRQADALGHFDATRRLLADELGVDPGPDLQRVYLQVLEQADDLEVAVLAAPRRSRTMGNIPAPVRRLVGRTSELDQVANLLDAHRLVTITGPGGVGKTTLALEVARQVTPPADGAWLVELAAVVDGATVVDRIATTIGVATEGMDAAGMVVDRLAALLADWQVLIVLDNCEHLLDDLAPVVRQLLAGAPGLRILATSRAPMATPGEVTWALPPLSLPARDGRISEAVELFVDRVQAHSPAFALDAATREVVAAVVRRLDGIPLAIELAAARTRAMSLDEVATALDDRFGTLASTQRGVADRQRTLRGAIDWSWDLLTSDQQKALAALSIAAHGVERGVAVQMLDAAGVATAAIDVLQALVEHSLVTVDASSSSPRFRMLETIRAYGRERLQELDCASAVQAQHLSVTLAALRRCHVEPSDPAVFGVDLDGLAAGLDDARQALQWAVANGEFRQAQQLAGLLGWLWLLRGLGGEGLAWLDRSMAGGEPQAEVAPDALLWANALRATVGSSDGLAWARRAIEAAPTPQRRILASLFGALHQIHAGEVDAALDELDWAVRQAGAVGGWLLGFAHLLRAQAGRLTGRFDGAGQHAESARSLLTHDSVDWARVQAIDVVIDAIGPDVDPVRARQLATEGLAICRRRNLPELEGRMLLQLGAATHAANDPDLARNYLDEALTLTASTASGPALGFALLVVGAHARMRGELDTALQQLRHAAELMQAAGMHYGIARAAVELGQTLVALGDHDQAQAVVAEVAEIAAAIGDPELLDAVDSITGASNQWSDGAVHDA